MIPETISMGGACFRTSYVQSFQSKKEWIDMCMGEHHGAFIDKNKETRKQLFGQIYDIAVPKKK